MSKILNEFADWINSEFTGAAMTTTGGTTMTIDFTCECDTPERSDYRVTDHDGHTVTVRYCEGCVELARIDWTGETAAIEAL